MKRSFNSTNRKRIRQDLVRFTVTRDAQKAPLSFIADLGGLKELALPPAAKIYVEASIKHSSLRFDFGSVGAMVHPAACPLDELDRGHSDVSFRVVVVDESGHLGRLLASGDGFIDEAETEAGVRRKPLLPAREVPLEQLVWKVEIDIAGGPQLLINSNVPGLLDRVRKDPALKGAIVPEAFRHVVQFMFDRSEDEATWFADWRQLLEVQLGLGAISDVDPDDDDEIATYVDDAVMRFAEKSSFAAKALPDGLIEEVLYE